MSPELSDNIQRTLGRLEAGISGLHDKLDTSTTMVSSHGKRIESLEHKQWYATGAVAAALALFKLWK